MLRIDLDQDIGRAMDYAASAVGSAKEVRKDGSTVHRRMHRQSPELDDPPSCASQAIDNLSVGLINQ